MTVRELKDKLNLEILCEGDMTREISGCYSGDLLSWVMSRLREDEIWLTVMGNINAVAVAVLTDCACIVLTEKAALDEAALIKAEQQGVCILTGEQNAYELSVAVAELLT
ncbi:MAG: DRTGG domain-containing protein [Oscillospiraceae bacterium]|nr:DRTGG domain-containing protein [Oscillospiraceae bacterium]MDD6146731.1 DRTGG domain-containing protein [Oscillospiraceae bacterium]